MSSYSTADSIESLGYCFLTFQNENRKTFSIQITDIDLYKNLRQNETIEDHYDRSDVYYYERWLDFISREEGMFTFRYRNGIIKDGRIIIINDLSEAGYYGFIIESFDLEDIRNTTNLAIAAMKEQRKAIYLSKDEYTIFLKKGNIILYENGKKVIILSNIRHHGDTWYGNEINRMNRDHMRENINDLRNGNFCIKFRNCGKEKLLITKQHDKYRFTLNTLVTYILDDSDNLQELFNDLSNFRW